MKKCPPGVLCFDIYNIVLLSIIIIAICYIFITHINDNNDNKFEKHIENQKEFNMRLKNELDNEKRKNNALKNKQIENQLLNENEKIVISQQNMDRLVNPLLAPERSPPYSKTFAVNIPNLGVPINIPTRGYSPDFQQVGVLANNNQSLLLPLFGKPMYNGSNKWWYYTLSDQQNSVKLPINNKRRDCQAEYGCDEIYDGDEVSVPILNTNFKVSIYKLDTPRYIIYI